MNAQTPPNKPDVNTYIEKFVKLRDKRDAIKEKHKEELKPFTEMLDALGGILLDHLNANGIDRVGAAAGTAHKILKKSVTIADKEAFWTFVVTSGKWELIDYKASPTGVGEFLAEQEVAAAQAAAAGQPPPAIAAPPGVNYVTHYEVGVRRPT